MPPMVLYIIHGEWVERFEKAESLGPSCVSLSVVRGWRMSFPVLDGEREG